MGRSCEIKEHPEPEKNQTSSPISRVPRPPAAGRGPGEPPGSSRFDRRKPPEPVEGTAPTHQEKHASQSAILNPGTPLRSCPIHQAHSPQSPRNRSTPWNVQIPSSSPRPSHESLGFSRIHLDRFDSPSPFRSFRFPVSHLRCPFGSLTF